MAPPRMVRNSTLREKCYSGQRPNFIAVDEVRRDRGSTASTEAKSILHKVKKSSNAYQPLKSVAEDLWLILDNCEVRPPLSHIQS